MGGLAGKFRVARRRDLRGWQIKTSSAAALAEALVGTRLLPECYLAWGPDADRHAKLLIQLGVAGDFWALTHIYVCVRLASSAFAQASASELISRCRTIH